jgi:hypothetical protein
MKKRSLLLGFVAAAIAAFIFSGCESATGSNGSPGRDGPGLALPGEEITPELLEAWFKATSTVILPAYTAGETTISGEVPADKTLVITGGKFVLKPVEGADGTFPAALTVKGTLELQEGSALNAGYYVTSVEGGVGWLKLDGGSLTGTGTVELPYIAPAVLEAPAETSTVPVGLVHYDNVYGVNKLPVSYVAADASEPVGELGHGGLVEIFKALAPENGDPEKAINKFTTPIKTVLVDVTEDGEDATDYSRAVPAGKTLTLTGGGSTIDGTVAGELVVTGTLDVTGISLPYSGKLHVDVGGTLTVGSLDLTGEAETGAGALVVDGTLVASGVVTGGTVKAPEEPTPPPTPPEEESVNRLKSEYPSVDSPNILIGEGGVLDLGVGGSIAETITNDGMINSASTTASVVTKLLTLPTGGGKVVLSGTGVGLGSAALALTQNIEITGTVNIPTGVATPFAYPEGGSKKTITIDTNGKLALGAAASITADSFDPDKVTITNNGAITTTSTTTATLNTVLEAVSGITGSGNIALDLQSFTVNAEFTVPTGLSVTGAITVAAGGTLVAPALAKPFVSDTVINIQNGGILSLAAENVSFDGVTISNGGTIATPETAGDKLNNILALGGKVAISLTAGTSASLSGAVIVPDGVTLDVIYPTTLAVAGTITVKAGGKLAAAPTIGTDGKVVFEYGSTGTEIGDSYKWLASAPYSKVTLLTNGETELTAGALSYAGSGSAGKLTIPEGTALTINGSLTVTTLAVAGTVTVKSGGTLTSSAVGES